MRCPSCGERDTRVVDSRDIDDSAIRRRRECNACATRFTTYERIESARLTVTKSDGRREEFDRDKLATGLSRALTRRPVAADAAVKAAEEIEAALDDCGVAYERFSAAHVAGAAGAAEVVRRAWDLSALAEAYEQFVAAQR